MLWSSLFGEIRAISYSDGVIILDSTECRVAVGQVIDFREANSEWVVSTRLAIEKVTVNSSLGANDEWEVKGRALGPVNVVRCSLEAELLRRRVSEIRNRRMTSDGAP